MLPCFVVLQIRFRYGQSRPIKAQSKLATKGGRTSARAFGRTPPVQQSDRDAGHDGNARNPFRGDPISASARRTVPRAQPDDERHRNRGWILPLFAGAAAITALTWVDTDVLRSSSDGFRIQHTGEGEPVSAEPAVPPTRPTFFHDVSANREFADALRSGGTGPTMMVVAQGSIRIGCWPANCPDPSVAAREFAVSRSFALAKHEVTVADYRRFATDTGRAAHVPAHWQPDGLPVVNVSWEDATAYAQWLSAQTNRAYRLPTESEWDYAAVAVEVPSSDPVVATASGSYQVRPERVGSRGANAWGLHDTGGNVSEWVAGCGELRTVPTGCEIRIRRGGSWIHSPATKRPSLRQVSGASLRSLDTGFRVASAVE